MAELATPAKKRKTKTSSLQYQLYIEMLESNPYFRENKISPDNPNEVANCWERLVKSLNSSGGPQKLLPEWKRVFTDWKCQVRKRARLIKNSSKETGNNGEPEKELTELEKKLLYLTGNVVIEGIPGIPELGTRNEANIELAIEEDEKGKAEERQTQATVIVEKKSRGNNTLMEINSHLAELVQLKRESLQLKRLKLQLKYNVTIEQQSNDASEN